MALETRVHVVVPGPREEVFELASSCEGLSRILHPLGPIPGVVRAEIEGGGPLATGARRLVTMTDGTVMDEAILAFERPSRHRYRWTRGPKPPFSWLVASGEATWDFSEAGDGTRVEWSYVFEPTSSVANPLLTLLLVVFRRWMAHGLDELRKTATR